MRKIQSIQFWAVYDGLQIDLEPEKDGGANRILVERRNGYLRGGRIRGSKPHYWVWNPYNSFAWRCCSTELGVVRAVSEILRGGGKP